MFVICLPICCKIFTCKKNLNEARMPHKVTVFRYQERARTRDWSNMAEDAAEADNLLQQQELDNSFQVEALIHTITINVLNCHWFIYIFFGNLFLPTQRSHRLHSKRLCASDSGLNMRNIREIIFV